MNDSPGDCQSSPPLRPGVPENERSEFSGWMKAGDSRCGCQIKEDGFVPSSFVLQKTKNHVIIIVTFCKFPNLIVERTVKM